MAGYQVKRAIGTMSGTSMDGIDVALVETDGVTISAFGPTLSVAYSSGDRDVLRAAIRDAQGIDDRGRRPLKVGKAENLITARHAEAIEQFLSVHSIGRTEVDVIGFHGQTVLHRPVDRLTVQIGNGQGLAGRLGLPVVWDFRAADVAACGQGAPLVPVFHQALARYLDMAGADDAALPLAFLNLGGVGNVTYVGADGELIAFDTGPGNALLDDWALIHTGQPVDLDGALAGSGQVDRDRLARLMGDPYFKEMPPKSLDRDHFGHFARASLEGLEAQEGAATLAAFTVESVAMAIGFLPQSPSRWIVCGGGVNNTVIMDGLESRLGVPVVAAEACGLSSEFMEAQAFAYLAVRHLNGLPLTFPGTTGVSQPLAGGVLARP